MIGVVGLTPVPFADVALRAYIDKDEERMKAQYERAINPNKHEVIDYDNLIFKPDARSLSESFNAAAPTGIPTIKVTMAPEAEVPPQRPAVKANAPSKAT